MDNSDLGKRMKEYEGASQSRLTRRMPVIIRIDGKAFHNFTKGLWRPFDDLLIDSMQETMKYLCENIQGCVLGYHQSDEISLFLVDYKRLESAAWFDNKVQKMCSIAASMATLAFNRIFSSKALEIGTLACLEAIKKGAMFDARCFTLPKEEVTNYFYWRQQDAIRNSIQMVGQANFSHRELQGKSCKQIQEMLINEKGIDWTDFSTYLQRGSCCIKEEYYVDTSGAERELEIVIDPDLATESLYLRKRWIVDKVIPVFKGEGREYVEKLF